MLKSRLKRTIKYALVSCCRGACRKVLLTLFICVLLIPQLFPIPTKAIGSNEVEISIRINRTVVTMPDLYEHLLLTLKAGFNADGSGAVLVLQKKMNLLGTAPIPLMICDIGDVVYVFFDITLDGPETTNEYQKSKVANSYDFFSGSEKKLTEFKIVSKSGNVFGEMKNLNPGDKLTGVVCLNTKIIEETTGATSTTTTTGTTVTATTAGTTVTANTTVTVSSTGTATTAGTTGSTVATTAPYTTTAQYTTAPPYTTGTAESTTGGGNLPVTNDNAPIGYLTGLSVFLAVLLAAQLIIFKKSKTKKEISEPEDR